MKYLFTLLIFGMSPLIANAQQVVDGADFQVRILNHVQRIEKDRKVGWATWFIAPDITNTKPFRGLVVGGIAMKDKHRRWLEVMGGGFVDNKTGFDPVLDVRFSDNSNKRVGLSVEFLRAFKSKRSLVLANITTPSPVFKQIKLRFGLESDAVWDARGIHVGLGLRFPFVLPGTKGKVTVAPAYQWGVKNQRDIFRVYAMVNW